MRKLTFIVCSVLCQCLNCRVIPPQNDVDWAKLEGHWYHLMFIPGGKAFLNCRRIQIENVNMEEKIVDITFNNTTYSNRHNIEDDSIYFRWYKDPGVIFPAVKQEKGKFKTTAASNLRKTITKKELKHEPQTCYILLSSDYSTYIILIECKSEGAPAVWVSLKHLTVTKELVTTIKSRLKKGGIDITTLTFSNMTTCS